MISAADGDVRHGAYGLTITGLCSPPASIGLVPVPAGHRWPSVDIRSQVGTAARPNEHELDDDRAVILLVGGEYAELDRRRGTVTFHTTRAVEESEIVHPYLASPAGVFTQWNGRVAVHAGGVIVDGGAWALLGDKGAGKTTILAELSRRGYGVVADDMVVVQGDVAFAGPRCLDLRPDAAARLGSAAAVAVREGRRTRLRLPAVPASVPFRGWIVLQDAGTVRARPVPLGERLSHLAGQLMMGARPPDAGLDLLSRPMLALQRPRRWRELDAAVDALVVAISRSGAPAPGSGRRGTGDRRRARHAPGNPRSAP